MDSIMLQQVLTVSMGIAESFFGTLMALPRLKRRGFLIPRIAAFAAFLVGIIFLMGFLKVSYDGLAFMIATTILGYFVVLGGLFWLSEDTKGNTVLTFAITIVLLEIERNVFSLLQSTSGTMLGLFLFGLSTGNGVGDVLLSILFRYILITLLFAPFWRHLFIADRPVLLRRVAVVTIIYTLMESVLVQIAQNNRGTNLAVLIVIYVFAIFCSLLLLLIFYYIFEKSNDLVRQQILENTIKEEGKHFERFRESVDYINIISHDLKKFLPEIENQLTEERKKAIQASLAVHESYQKTGNEVMDVILFEKALSSHKDGIRLSTMIDGKRLSFLSEEYLYSLFSNILDNAIEAVRDVADKDKKIVSLLVHEERHFLIIEESNYYSGERKMEDSHLVTTKKDGHGHGYGTRSIDYVVSRLNGTCTIQMEQGIFSLRIVIPVPEGKEEEKEGLHI